MSKPADLYSRITNRIIADLESGTRPWHEALERRTCRRAHHPPACGTTAFPTMASTSSCFGTATVDKGYACPIWLTFKQAQELGGTCAEGRAWRACCLSPDSITRTETDEKGDETEREIPFLKGYTVFNAEQIDNLPPHFTAHAATPLP